MYFGYFCDDKDIKSIKEFILTIKKIKKLKNLGIFSNYQWDNTLPEFKRYNLFYGWNGSGKTTLTKLLDILRTGVNSDYEEVEYTVESSTGDITMGIDSNLKIRVFNEDYINANVQLQNCKANPIFILGEENNALIEQIKSDEATLETKKEELKILKDANTSLKNQYEAKFTEIARTISANASGEATRRYDRRNAIDAFEALKSKKELSADELRTNQTSLKQLEKPKIDKVIIKVALKTDNEENPPKEINFDQTLIDKYYSQAKNLLNTKILSKSIERLRENKSISDWVEEGLKIHRSSTTKVCEFCNSEIPENRFEELNAHFNKEDSILKDNLNESISSIKNFINVLENLQTPDKANLYEELQDSYRTKNKELKQNISDLITQLKDVLTTLEDKKHKVNIEVIPPAKPEYSLVSGSLIELNDVISKHNDKTSNFIAEKKTAETVLETHYLSTIKDDINVIVQDSKTMTKDINEIEKEIDTLKTSIAENKSKITSPESARQQLNRNIHQFLGRNDISFEPVGDGYLIKRGTTIAKHLSEGEKTAIAFAYFIVHLKDQDFNIDEGIVVIDDPVSSLDSNSIYQAFSFLKSSVKDAKQVFIFTHNFDFLRLLLNWLYPYNERDTQSYMIKNPMLNSQRVAEIDELDPTLKNYESEYHYLFKKLYDFKSTGEIESVYHIPNIARKVLDTFLMFRVPNSLNKHKKLDLLKSVFDEKKLTSLNKFTNDNSHITGKGFDPSLIPECEKNVRYLMELIETTFPEHYKILLETL